MTDKIVTTLSQCSLGDRAGAAGVQRNGDSDPKMLGDNAGSFISVLGIYFDGETDPSCTLYESHPHPIAEQASQAASVEASVSANTAVASAPILTRSCGIYEDMDSLECPPLSSSPTLSITDDVPCTPPLALAELHSPLLTGLNLFFEETVDCSKCKTHETIDNIPNQHSSEFFTSDGVPVISAPRMLTIALPLEDDN